MKLHLQFWLSAGKKFRGQKTVCHCFLNDRLLFLLFFPFAFLKFFWGQEPFRGEVSRRGGGGAFPL